jgi:hypothetical protein
MYRSAARISPTRVPALVNVLRKAVTTIDIGNFAVLLRPFITFITPEPNGTTTLCRSIPYCTYWNYAFSYIFLLAL